jgi:hypothetical protein
MDEQVVGSTRDFVLAKGFIQVGVHATLIGEDDTRRLFAELHADPDRPEVRPQEAYQSILSSMQPGWTLRLMQIFWPDPEPRLEFQKQVQNWNTALTGGAVSKGSPDAEGLDILRQGLLLAVAEYPLPFVRRTVLEFVLPGDEGIAWWRGLVGLCAGFGLRVRYLDRSSIEKLIQWIMNPNLEYQNS